MNIEPNYDIAIVGSGSGGAEAALEAARRGARILLIEKHLLGGGALSVGTIPMRSLMASERILRHLRWDGADEDHAAARLSDWVTRQRRTVARLTTHLEDELRAAGVGLARGRAQLLGEGRIRIVDINSEDRPERIAQATAIILATGSKPREADRVWVKSAVGTSRRFISLTEPPARLVIIGGGHIGCEFACVYRALGTEVTLIEKGDRLLPEMDCEAGEWLRAEFEKNGIQVRLGEEACAAWGHTSSEFAVAGILPDGEEVSGDKILVATGRVPNVLGLGLEKAGVRFDVERGIEVNEFLQTTAPGIFAIGDVNGLCTLADSAQAQAGIAVKNALGGRAPFHREDTPRRIHTDPPIAAVGLLEDEARAAGFAIRSASARFYYGPTFRGHGEPGLVKLVANAISGRLLGGMIVGDGAFEGIGELSVGLQMSADARVFAEAPRAQESFATALRACVQEMFGETNGHSPVSLHGNRLTSETTFV